MKSKLGTQLSQLGILRDPVLISAFDEINRADFVSKDFGGAAYGDYPLPIGFGQTISQPSTVAFMLELLSSRGGEKILDLGSGSGWTTALLSDVVGPDGFVVGVEIVPELVEISRKNLAKYPELSAVIKLANQKLGAPEEAPFDRMLVSAAAEKREEELLNQLKPGGRLVMPIGGSIFVFDKSSSNEVTEEEYPGYIFVPLIKIK